MKRGPQSDASESLLKKARNFVWGLLFAENPAVPPKDGASLIGELPPDVLAYILHFATEEGNGITPAFSAISKTFSKVYDMYLLSQVGISENQLGKALVKQQEEINYLLENKKEILENEHDNKTVVDCLEKLEKCAKAPVINNFISFFNREKMLNQINEIIIRQRINLDDTNLFCSNCCLTRFPGSLLERAELSEYWSRLSRLYLNNNRLTVLPAEIERLRALYILSLDDNQLTTLPEQIGKLKNLSFLLLDNNQLTTLPEQIGQLERLSLFTLQNNQLTALPVEITQLRRLCELRIDNNKLIDLPANLSDEILFQNHYIGIKPWCRTNKAHVLTTQRSVQETACKPSHKRKRAK